MPPTRILHLLARIPAVVWACMILAFCLRLYGIDFGLPLHLHPDEWSQAEIARGVLRGHFNPGFFRYPSLTIYLLAGIYTIVESFGGLFHHLFSQETYYLIARILSAGFGALIVFPVFYIGSRVGKLWTGFTAAILVAIEPELVRQSHFATVDMAATFWCLTALALSLAVRWGDLKSYRAASITAGLALSTKYSAVYVLPVILGLIAWDGWQRKGNEPVGLGSRRRALAVLTVSLAALGAFAMLPQDRVVDLLRNWTTDGIVEQEYIVLLHRAILIGSLLCMVMGILSLVSLFRVPVARFIETITGRQFAVSCVCIVAVFAVTSPFVILDPAVSVRDIAYESRHVSIGSAAHFKAGDPILGSIQPNQQPGDRSFYWDWWIKQNGWVMLAAIVLGIVIVVRKDIALLLALAVPLLLLAVSLAAAGNKADRYALLMVPITGILAASALSAIAPPRPMWRVWFYVIATTALAVVPTTNTLVMLRAEFALPDTRTLAFRWLKGNVPPGAVLVREAYTPDVEAATPSFKTVKTAGAFEDRSLDAWRAEGVTYFVIGKMRSWYQENARYYPGVVSQYRSLDTAAMLVREFHADSTCLGPPVAIYRLH